MARTRYVDTGVIYCEDNLERLAPAEATGRTVRTSMGWSVLSLAVSSVVIFVLGLVYGPGDAEGLSLVVGLWLGFFLAWGAFRLFGWGRWAARSIYLWGIVGAVLVLFVLFTLGTLIFGVIPNTPSVTIPFWTAFGLVLGAVTAAGGIDRRPPEEDRGP